MNVFSLNKFSRKAVSPLVATVLLIAFAVSLGAVVMNWTSGAIQNESHDELNGVCNSVYISILDRGSSKAICLDRINNKIIIDIENGPMAIDGLRLSYLAKSSDFMDYIKKIEGGILSHVELSYDVALYGELSNVKIVPIVDDNVCSEGGRSFSVITDC